MEPQLAPSELRVLGCLMEKFMTTPDYYPLTLNALTHACNQKSNRNPVMEFSEDEVFDLLSGLRQKELVEPVYTTGNRSERYRQVFTERLGFSRRQNAVLCELFVRGPQTPGELNSRAGRMASFGSAAGVTEVLEELASFPAGPVVKKLSRMPGQKDSRWTHLFAPIVQDEAESDSGRGAAGARRAEAPAAQQAVLLRKSGDERVVQLEQEVTALKREIRLLNERMDGVSRHVADLARDLHDRPAKS